MARHLGLWTFALPGNLGRVLGLGAPFPAHLGMADARLWTAPLFFLICLIGGSFLCFFTNHVGACLASLASFPIGNVRGRYLPKPRVCS